MPKMKMQMKKFERMNLIFEFSISKLGYVTIFMKILQKKFDPFFKTLLTKRDKNEDANKNIWENEFDLWILPIKIRLYGTFMKICGKKSLTHFLGHLWLIGAKIKIKMKKYRKMSSIFQFPISKLGYVAIFKKIW